MFLLDSSNIKLSPKQHSREHRDLRFIHITATFRDLTKLHWGTLGDPS